MVQTMGPGGGEEGPCVLGAGGEADAQGLGIVEQMGMGGARGSGFPDRQALQGLGTDPEISLKQEGSSGTSASDPLCWRSLESYRQGAAQATPLGGDPPTHTPSAHLTGGVLRSFKEDPPEHCSGCQCLLSRGLLSTTAPCQPGEVPAPREAVVNTAGATLTPCPLGCCSGHLSLPLDQVPAAPTPQSCGRLTPGQAHLPSQGFCPGPL